MTDDQPTIRNIDYPSHLAGQLAGQLDLATRIEKPLVALGGAPARALMRIMAEAFEPNEWPDLQPREEDLRQQIAAHLANRIAAMVDEDPPPGQYL